MTLHEERDLLLDLAYGELSEADARRVRDHVAGCEACRAELDQLLGTRRLVSALPVLEAPPRGEQALLAAARAQAARARPRPRAPRWLVPAVALAATITAVTVVTLEVGEEALAPVARREAPPPQAPAAAPGAAAEPEAPPATAPAPQPAERQAYAEAPPPSPPLRAAPQRRKAAPAPEAAPAPAPAPEREVADADAPAPEVMAEAPAAAPPPAAAAPAPRAAARADERALSAPEAAAGAASPAPEVRTFADCPGELRREIGRDGAGRVVRFAREGLVEGRRVRVELTFGQDGAVTSARGREVATGAAVPAGALPGLPRTAAQVDPDAPPRCGR